MLEKRKSSWTETENTILLSSAHRRTSSAQNSPITFETIKVGDHVSVEYVRSSDGRRTALTVDSKSMVAPASHKASVAKNVKAAPQKEAVAAKSEVKAGPKKEAAAPKAEIKAEAKKDSLNAPKPEAKVEPKKDPATAQKTEVKAEPKKETDVAPKAEAKAEVKKDTSAAAKPEAKVEPKKDPPRHNRRKPQLTADPNVKFDKKGPSPAPGGDGPFLSGPESPLAYDHGPPEILIASLKYFQQAPFDPFFG